MPVSIEADPLSTGTPVQKRVISLEPAAYEILRSEAASPLLFLCDHGGQSIPVSLAHHDWSMARDRHVAYDIGAATMTRYLSTRFDAPAVIGIYSRLVVDLNRFCHDPTFIPPVSDGIVISANADLNAEETERRIDAYFAPYHIAVSNQLDRMMARPGPLRIILMHSMTDRMGGTVRKQHAEIMFADDDRLGRPLLAQLREDDSLCIGENEPYRLDETDYTAVTHCVRRGLPHVQTEVRQDLIGTHAEAEAWAARLGDAIEAASFAEPS